ncbi:hypothetical protein SDC9_202803 [bioreactor metagenome]|uniref:Uncharacterized protein n=1 Tax=bioreactor metagenome TaxID=1076179 RepID=A0A645J3Q6_9ZZZZ
MIQSAGMSYNDFTVQYLSNEEQATAMQDGNIDVASYYSAVPTGGVEQLAAENDIRLISLDEELINKCISDWGFKKHVIEAGSYSWQTEDVDSIVADFHAIFVNQDMDADLAYRITKTCMDHIQELWNSNPGMDKVDNTCLDGWTTPALHPGAIRYYEEIGAKIPEGAYPPEYKKN